MLFPLLIANGFATPLNDSLDPWGRPTHARVIIEPPETVEDLHATERRFRFWWDDVGLTATIEIRGTMRWKTLASDVPLGWISDELPRDSVFRIRLEGGTRTSDPIVSARYYGPTDLARLSVSVSNTDSSWMLSDTILDLDISEGSNLWGANYSGGLIEITSDKENPDIQVWTRWDGLPDDRVLSVSVDDDVTWVGMATGLAKIYDGKVLQVWDDELVDPYVQTLDSKDGVVYVGTYQGLDRLSGQTIEHLLPAWSIFSILTDGTKTAVGYEGITFIKEDGTHSTQDWPGNVNALEQVDGALWMATEKNGLVRSTAEGTTVLLEDPIHAMTHIGARVYLAGSKNIWSLPSNPQADASLTPKGEMIGMGTHYALEGYSDRLWIGSSNGLHTYHLQDRSADLLPYSPWHTTGAVYGIVPRETGLLVSLEKQFPPLALQEEPLPLHFIYDVFEEPALHEDNQGTWLWSEHVLYQIPDGEPIAHTAVSGLIDITEWLGNTWIATNDGLSKFTDGNFEQTFEKEGIQELSSDGRTMWFRTDSSIHHVLPTEVTEYETPAVPTAISPAGLAVCVGTEDGLFRLWKGRKGDKMWENPLGFQDQNVKIVSVVGDAKAGCWMAGEDGSIGYIAKDGHSQWWHLPEPDPPTIHSLVLDRGQAWVLTESGAWLLW